MEKRKRSFPEWFSNPPKVAKITQPSAKEVRKRPVVYYMSPEELVKAAKYVAADVLAESVDDEAPELGSTPVNVGASTSRAGIDCGRTLLRERLSSSPEFAESHSDCIPQNSRCTFDRQDLFDVMDKIPRFSDSDVDGTGSLMASTSKKSSDEEARPERVTSCMNISIKQSDAIGVDTANSNDNTSITLLDSYLDTQFSNMEKEETPVLSQDSKQCGMVSLHTQFSSGTGQILKDLLDFPEKGGSSVGSSCGHDPRTLEETNSSSAMDEVPSVSKSRSFNNTETYLDDIWFND